MYTILKGVWGTSYPHVAQTEQEDGTNHAGPAAAAPRMFMEGPCYIERFLATKVATQMLKVSTKSTQCVVILIEMIF